MAACALGSEERLAAVRVAAPGDSAGPATGCQQRGEEGENRGRAAHLRRRLARGAQLRNGLLARRVDGEDAVEAGDLEDLGDVPVAAHERQLSVVCPQAFD